MIDYFELQFYSVVQLILRHNAADFYCNNLLLVEMAKKSKS